MSQSTPDLPSDTSPEPEPDLPDSTDLPPGPLVELQRACVNQIQSFFQRMEAAFEQGEDFTPTWPWHDCELGRDRLEALSATVQEIYRHYATQVMDHDWGTVHLARWQYENWEALVLYVSTDGEDGWLELLTAKGEPLSTARTFGDMVYWGDPTLIRSQVMTGELPPQLEAMIEGISE